ncbi:MAG: hypothetical protein PWP52_1289 [Bacteroidales bacterium]|nr:hypothetical protein [Bacteroidales bacterium]
MKMKKIVFLFAITLQTFALQAQINSFDLSTYQLPDIKRHQLDLTFDLNGHNSVYDRYQRNSMDQFYKTNSIYGDLGLNYNFYRNSRKYQGNQDIMIDFSSSFNNRKDKESTLYESFDAGSTLRINSENRFYFKEKWFVSTNLHLNGQLYRATRDQEVNSTENRENNLTLNIPLGIGVGRIEQVQDAWLAIYILDELNKEGRLTRTPTTEEIIEFSQLISQLKNERFFDARLQKIKEIEAVDSFLQSKNLIENADARYFAVVNDNWDHAVNRIRNSGKRVSFHLEPGYVYTSDFFEQQQESYQLLNEHKITEYSIQGALKYIDEKPINRFWQSSFSFQIAGKYLKAINKDIENDTKVELEAPQLTSSVNYAVGFYPNSRTNLVVSLGVNYFNSFGEENINSEKVDISHFEISPVFSTNLNYYISPQLRINANYRLNYLYLETNSEYYYNMYNDFFQQKDFNHSINVGFIYQIY